METFFYKGRLSIFVLTTEMSYYGNDNKEMVIQTNHGIKHNDLFTPYIDIMY